MTDNLKTNGDAAPPASAPPTPGRRLLRDPRATRAAILAAAVEEFSHHGYGGARVDAIAARACTNKRMLYHYFGDKEALYLAVLESIYGAIRQAEKGLDLAHRDPLQAMRDLALFTWRYFLNHPEFLSLLATENLLKAQHLKRSKTLAAMHSHFIGELSSVLDRGAKSGVFRPDIDPLSVYMTIAALGFFYLNNRHTISTIFGRDLFQQEALEAWGEHIVSVTLASIKP
ncbi:TetR/AcrR family transcriptional regulator [Rhizobium paknamense]|uniref:TetR/AcrR family transcriptional regulator n=1 Tax=Rhizobium paknamense TaxID=1206817 RepID=A0ABU0IDX3_9HYPH|nr:TetR/AcrR family transcriptional regulator [Rhizobium paknamense]MDQ0456432.1 TetR/AcrR family transcriptional regulator [Rhizobium paknamense]